MPLGSYLLYQAGYVPGSDAAAQQRCFEMVNRALSKLNHEAATGNDSVRPELQQLGSVRNLLQPLAGSYNWRKANNFWSYWDKNKKQILQAASPEESYLDLIEKLEDGRYYDE